MVRYSWNYILQNKIDWFMATFMASSLSNLVDNLIEGIHKIKFKDYNRFLNMRVSVKYNKIQ